MKFNYDNAHIRGKDKTAMLYDLVTLKISLIVFYASSFNRIRSHNFLKHAVLQLLSWPWHQEGRRRLDAGIYARKLLNRQTKAEFNFQQKQGDFNR